MHHSIHNLAQTHYENFPVGSIFIPKKYRKPIHLIYTFARVADDIADEGNFFAEERIAQLNALEFEFDSALNGKANDTFFAELADEIQRRNLSVQLFNDLLTAFRWDAEARTYATFDGVLRYCQYSANPIGRLLLQIFNSANDENNKLSDCICTALQLTNFWQDISVDSKRNRFYIPHEDFARFYVSAGDLLLQNNDRAVRTLLKFEIDRTMKLFDEGKPLIHKVHRDFQFELKLIWNGGVQILKKIESLNYDTRLIRPQINFFDKIFVLVKSFI